MNMSAFIERELDESMSKKNVIRVLKKYMVFKDLQGYKPSVRTSVWSDMPKSKGVKTNEDRIIHQLEKEQLACSFIKTVDMALDRLPSDEKEIITLLYLQREKVTITKVCTKLFISHNTVNRIRNRALLSLAHALCIEAYHD